jgi:hypothetical protein
MPNFKKLALSVMSFLPFVIAMAQTSAVATTSKEGGLMRSEGKIYVVMAVVITLFAGLLVYIIRLDKKITRLEKGNL